MNINHRSSFSRDCSMQGVHPEFHLEAFPHEYFSGMVLVKDIFFKTIFLIHIKVLCKVVCRAFMSKGWSCSECGSKLTQHCPGLPHPFHKVMAETHSSQNGFGKRGMSCATGSEHGESCSAGCCPAMLQGFYSRGCWERKNSQAVLQHLQFPSILSGSQRQIWSHTCLCDLQHALGVQLRLLKNKEIKD